MIHYTGHHLFFKQLALYTSAVYEWSYMAYYWKAKVQ